MSAAVIAFPQRPARGSNDYAWMTDASRRLALEQTLEELLAEATPVKPEADNRQELLMLLRRIDRRLAKLCAPAGLAKQASTEL